MYSVNKDVHMVIAAMNDSLSLLARPLAKHEVHLFIAPHSPYEMGTVILPISQMGKLRLKEVKMLTPDEKVGKWNGYLFSE